MIYESHLGVSFNIYEKNITNNYNNDVSYYKKSKLVDVVNR